MTKERAPSWAEQALSSTDRHGRSLRAVNEKLADLVASLRDQKQRLAEYAQPVTPVPLHDEAATGARSTGRASTVEAELALVREALRNREEEHRRLRDRLAEIEADNRRICDEFVEVQEQNADLVTLNAAIERLHGAVTRDELLVAIQEIVINVIGSEEFALFELTADGKRLAPALAFGLDSDALTEVAIGVGAVGRAVAEGRPYIAGEAAPAAARESPHLTACIPFKLGDTVSGALVIYRLLGQKPSLTAFDAEIFSLLERHAGLALHFRAPARPEGAR